MARYRFYERNLNARIVGSEPTEEAYELYGGDRAHDADRQTSFLQRKEPCGGLFDLAFLCNDFSQVRLDQSAECSQMGIIALTRK